MAEIKFPNRPCPKCGKPIHIKAKSHECGWKAEEASASKTKLVAAKLGGPKPTAAKPTKASGLSNMEAMRRVLSSTGNDAKPLEIQEQLKKQFGIRMETSVISNYKSIIAKQAGKSVKRGRPARTALVPGKAKLSGVSAISIDDIRAVKALAERLGAEKLRQLAEVLG